jgi:hypothetical protein
VDINSSEVKTCSISEKWQWLTQRTDRGNGRRGTTFTGNSQDTIEGGQEEGNNSCSNKKNNNNDDDENNNNSNNHNHLYSEYAFSGWEQQQDSWICGEPLGKKMNEALHINSKLSPVTGLIFLHVDVVKLIVMETHWGGPSPFLSVSNLKCIS